ncbi:hypothetical protein IJH66_00595 [Candidatus Saccharibacteria bacterium]|nr:hypothetical protein [Candidatus Saccharibacteria bacterium]
MKKLFEKILRWFDELGLAFKGVLLASRYKSFYLPALLGFLGFGTLLNLFSGGLSSFSLIGASGFLGTLKIIANAFLGVFGINKNLLDWLPIFFLALLQGTLIGLIVFVYKKNKEKAEGSAETVGIVAGLAILGSGCPTCGTTLLAPLIGTIFSGSSFAVAGLLSGVITFLAVLVAFFSFKKVGFETYAIIKSENYNRKKKNHEEIA